MSLEALIDQACGEYNERSYEVNNRHFIILGGREGGREKMKGGREGEREREREGDGGREGGKETGGREGKEREGRG